MGLSSCTFSSGAGDTLLQYCVTANGSITQMQMPAGQERINQGITVGEGCGVCNESPATAYYDFGGWADSGNWNAPQVLSHTASSINNARTTSDGIWTLTETITQTRPRPPSRSP